MIKIILSVGLATILVTGCKTPEEKKPVSDETIQIRVTPAEYMEYIIPVRGVGLLGTMTEMKLSFKTGGIVKQVITREGQQVKKGAMLASLDLSEIMAQVEQAGIGLEKAGRDLKRAENLYRDSVATLEQFQNARSAYELAKSQKKIADFNLVHSRIIAPADGKVQKILVETNEMIGPGYPAILFASTENDWVVRVALTDRDIVRLTIGDTALITMDAFADQDFRAEVAELGAIADPVTGTYEAELLILQGIPQFRAGFIARAEIYPSELEMSLTVPLEALVDASDNNAYAFIFTQGKVVKRRIRTGMIINADVVVLDGLNEGELVVTEGVSYLREDSKVSLVNHNEADKP